MGFGTTFERDLLKLLMNATAIANIADSIPAAYISFPVAAAPVPQAAVPAPTIGIAYKTTAPAPSVPSGIFTKTEPVYEFCVGDYWDFGTFIIYRYELVNVSSSGLTVTFRGVDSGREYHVGFEEIRDTGGRKSRIQPGQTWTTTEKGRSNLKVLKCLPDMKWSCEFVGYSNQVMDVPSDQIIKHYTLDQPKALSKKTHPHSCTKCGSQALVLFQSIECSNNACAHFKP